MSAPAARAAGPDGGGWAAMGPMLRLTVRRSRLQILAWVLPLWGLVLAVPSYESAYPDREMRQALVEGMRDNAGTRLLYGVLPLPGTIGQFAQWEVGSYLLVCTALMAIMLTCRLLRADEEDGLVEVVRAAGVGQRVPVAAPLLVVMASVALLATGAGGLLHLLSTGVEELTAGGAWVMAGTIAVSGWAFTAVAALACQLVRTGSAARTLAMSALGLAFGLRVAADESGAAWLRWATPLGWRDLVRPYSQDRIWPLLVGTGAALALLASAAVLARRREYRGACLPERSVGGRRWRVRSHVDLLARLVAPSTAAWVVAATALAALFGSMSGTITQLLEPGSPTAAYVDKMAEGSPVVQFMSLLTVFTALLAAVGAVQRALGLAGDEREGLAGLQVATGISRSGLFLARVGAALGEGALLLGISGGVLALVTATQTTQDREVERALVFTLTQMPGLAAAVGLALALVGLAPRCASLVWAVVAWSAFAQFLGSLVELPDWAVDASVLGHHLDVVGPHQWRALAAQAAVGAVATAIGWAAYRRRDLGA